jgi:phosphoglycolate phosphatase-like HAD superfamily hydrolase
MNIYLDLDGPLLDVSEKYWQVHKDVLLELGENYIPKEKYWDLKRKKIPEKNILMIIGAEGKIEKYSERRIELIETQSYIKYDRIWDGVQEVLINLKQRHRLVLVTLRRSRSALEEELDILDLTRFLDKILSSGEQRTLRWSIKADLIRSDNHLECAPGIMVGDTETDICAGKMLGLKTIGVLSGIRTEHFLEEAGADILISYITELPQNINSLHASSVKTTIPP